MNSIEWLQQWYFEQCDDLWEHRHGITIRTLDNPGWLVTIDLKGTALENAAMPEIGTPAAVNHGGIEGMHDWLQCKVEEQCFTGAGGPQSLFAICDAFRRWVEEAGSQA
jgi:hypothetical protein